MMLRDDYPIWTCIGGGLEAGEEFEDALHREVLEETGLEVNILREGIDYFAPLDEQLSHYHCVRSYLCKAKDDLSQPLLQDEGICLKWFDQDKLPPNVPPKNLIRLKETIQDIERDIRVLDYLPDMKRFSKNLKREDIYHFDFWVNHPKVKTKNSAAHLEL